MAKLSGGGEHDPSDPPTNVIRGRLKNSKFPHMSSLTVASLLLASLPASVRAQPDAPASAQPDAPVNAQPAAPANAQPAAPASAQPAAPANAQSAAFAETQTRVPGEQQQALPVPSLKEVLEKAEKRAPQVRLGTAALQVSRTEYASARRPPLGNPYFEVLGQHGSNGATQGLNIGAQLWLPIELVGQRGKRIEEADAYVDLHQRTLNQAQASALGETVHAYGAALVAGARVRVLEDVVRMSKTTAELYEARLEAGDAILRDATIARVEHAKNQVLIQDAYGQLAIALAELGRLTGERYGSVAAEVVGPPALKMDEYLTRSGAKVAPAVASAEAEAKYYESQRARLKRESWGNFQLMLMGGRGDLGETRLGAGVAYEVPAFRRNQGESARAEAERLRAQTERSIRESYIDARIAGIVQQFRQLQKAHEVISDVALPAANNAVNASQATLRAGKEDWFIVLMTRRDLAMLKLQNLDLIERQWLLLGELVHLTGELP